MSRIRYILLVAVVFLYTGNYAQKAVTVSGQKSVDASQPGLRHSYDVLKYNLSVDLYACYSNPYPTSFDATEVITFKVSSVLNSIKLNAVNHSLTIDSVGLAGVSFSHAMDTLTIHLNRTYHPGEEAKVKISYQHKNVRDHAVYSNEGFVYTDTPPEGSRKWFPCWDRPSDKALLELTAKVPLNVKLGSNGSLADSAIRHDTLIYHWISHDPMATYLMTLTSKTNFGLDIVYWHKWNHRADSIPVRFYYERSLKPGPVESIIVPMTDYFSKLFGEYPFEKIGFASLDSSFPWGGMENQTMINLTPSGWNEGVVCHEFSHMWFGDLITCGTWADIWLNESFGTYCESLWLEHRSGKSAYKRHLAEQASHYLEHNPSIPVYNSSWTIHTPDPALLYNSALVYHKGACVLHQLRYVVGDSNFFHLLKAYATDPDFMFKNAVTSDFITKANEICGTDLGWFFEEWIFQPNHPLYANSYEIQGLNEGKWKVKLLLSQTQTLPAFFKMPVQVCVVFTDSTEKVMEVMNDRNYQSFEFIFLKKPAYLVFDPHENILLKQAKLSRK
ncbi:MAG: M1 family metallopeptidase [Bacteroidetes bacterium]|nr:M1 family metallopeptidase [Bacteroidota bacterium]